MKKRSRIITIIAICGITMFMLLISQYKNLNAQSDITDKSREKLAYQAKGKKNAGKKGSPPSKNPETNRDKESKVLRVSTVRLSRTTCSVHSGGEDQIVNRSIHKRQEYWA
jgi:hypothetical protein